MSGPGAAGSAFDEPDEREEGMPSHLIGGSRRYRISQAEAWHERRTA